MEPQRDPSGAVAPGFLETIRADREAFSRLSSQTKVWLYRAHGASIGEGVVIAPGAVILSARIELADQVRIGKDVSIETSFLKIGALSHLGERSSLRARKAVLHENVFVGARVEIGGGGAGDPESEIEIGSHCHVGQDVHLNCCRRLEIGEETTVSMGTMVMTHAFANSVLEGYPAVFSPVRIGSRVQIGLRCVIFPGVSIEDGAVVGSNSNVMSKVARETYVCGVPARPVCPARKKLSPERVRGLAAGLVADFLAQIQAAACEVAVVRREPFETAADIVRGSSRLRLLFAETLDEGSLAGVRRGSDETVVVFLHGPGGAGAEDGLVLIDLLGKRISGRGGLLADSLREFLRKRGIRLEPRAWTYRGGLIERFP